MASLTIEDLLALAEACPELRFDTSGKWLIRDFHGGHLDNFTDTVKYMFGDDVGMAKALVGQIHALQAQIRAMRAEREPR